MKWNNRKIIFLVAGACLLLAFLAWRMIRPLSIFVVTDEFAKPMAVTSIPPGLDSLRASECGECHAEIYREWSKSMHAQAWTDPYYQIDFVFDGSQQVCLNCHIPLQNQQENLVTGFKDRERLKPLLKKNPDFDAELQQEGVTCAVCHVRDNYIIGPYGDTEAPHPSRYDPAMTDGLGACRKCHVVSGKRWDTFYRLPPCGTVAEIREEQPGEKINCTKCHMPEIVRPAAEGSLTRTGGMHTWKGGHDRETVRQALQVDFEVTRNKGNKGRAHITLTNTGADHYLPTGTPDRHLSVEFRLKNERGETIKQKTYLLMRHIMWRPFIVDLWDTRLAKDISRSYSFPFQASDFPAAAELEVTVRYHLLAEARRKKIAYNNQQPISHVLYQHTELLK
jgi:hypothetical protein